MMKVIHERKKSFSGANPKNTLNVDYFLFSDFFSVSLAGQAVIVSAENAIGGKSIN